MSIKLRVTLSDSDAAVEAKLLKAVQKGLNQALRAATVAIRRRMQGVCESLIKGTSEYESLLSGELLGELGIPNVQARLRQILDTIRRGVQVQVSPIQVTGNRIRGGLSVLLLKTDFEDILGLPAATYVSNGRYTIPWLDWLIVQGDRIAVIGYDVHFDLDQAQRLRSRTGLALMFPRPGFGWRVPPQYSGTPANNFITRAFSVPRVEAVISQIMQEEIQRRLT